MSIDKCPQKQSFNVSDMCRATWLSQVYRICRDIQPTKWFDLFVLAKFASKCFASRMSEFLEEC